MKAGLCHQDFDAASGMQTNLLFFLIYKYTFCNTKILYLLF